MCPLTLASAARRIVARIVDGLLVLYLAAVVTLAPSGSLSPHLYWLAWVALTLLYDFVSVAVCGKQLGKLIVGIRVIDSTTGCKPNVLNSFIRSMSLMLMLVLAQAVFLFAAAAKLAKLPMVVAASVPPAAILVATLATIFGSQSRQGLHDKSAETLVVKDKSSS
ncbi:RDD family protein [Candidatus Poriferisodalis sp.]|uniref:RDD family protein n=1 Tax=Candidatus Poriferisodalis sp. TaxID=3101277 RepID=UPI003B02E603